jgi:hypothetical protein
MAARSLAARRSALLTVLVALLALLLPTGSAAAGADGLPVTYMGTFVGDDVLFVPLAGPDASQCDTEKFPDITGTWRVTLRDDKAPLVSVQMFSAGKAHVMYGGNAFGVPWTLETAPSGATFKVSQPVFGNEFSMTLVGTVLTYYLAPYQAFEQNCASGTITGALTRTAS